MAGIAGSGIGSEPGGRGVWAQVVVTAAKYSNTAQQHSINERFDASLGAHSPRLDT
jgi:hypothetical protein